MHGLLAPRVFILILLLARLHIRVTAFSSRGLMSSGVPLGTQPPFRVALIGDFLSWDSADYKLAEALDSSFAIEETLYLQLDEIEADLLSLQLRSFDPNTLLVSIRTRAFEHILPLALKIVRTECRLGERIVVIAFHLQAHAIPAAQRAFAGVSSSEAGGSLREDRYEHRAAAHRDTYGVVLEPVPFMMDDWGPIIMDDVQEGGLMPLWFGPSVPERWCRQLSESKSRSCSSRETLYDIIVLGSPGGCATKEQGHGESRSEACRVAGHVQKRYGEQHRVLVLQSENATAAAWHLSRAQASSQRDQLPQQQQQESRPPPEPKPEVLLASAQVLIITQPGRAEVRGFSGVQHAVEALALGAPHLIINVDEISAQGYDQEEVFGM